MEIKRNGANGRRAQSVSYNGILYTSGITTTDLDADITGQTQDVIHIIDNILARNGIDKTLSLIHIWWRPDARRGCFRTRFR